MKHFDFVTFAAKSDVGRKRKNNEDAYGAFPEIGVWLVADGMGGGDDGEIASAQVVKEFAAFAEAHRFPDGAGYPTDSLMPHVAATVNAASRWVFDYAKGKRLSSCGSTVVGCVLDRVNPGRAVAFHAGDSRLYLLSGDGIRQVTRDHSAAEAIGIKDETKLNPVFRSMILRAVGVTEEVDVELTPFDVRPQDRILICSDGLSRMVDDESMLRISRGQKEVEDATVALIEAANAAGGVDNVTAVLIQIGELPVGVPKAELAPPTVIARPKTPQPPVAEEKVADVAVPSGATTDDRFRRLVRSLVVLGVLVLLSACLLVALLCFRNAG